MLRFGYTGAMLYRVQKGEVKFREPSEKDEWQAVWECVSGGNYGGGADRINPIGTMDACGTTGSHHRVFCKRVERVHFLDSFGSHPGKESAVLSLGSAENGITLFICV